MTKLTDTHRTILAAAGARESSLVLPIPKSLKLNAANAEPILRVLLEGGLIVEQAAEDGAPVWRRDDSGQNVTLVATPTGLKAVGIEATDEEAKPAATKTSSKKAKAQKVAAPAKSTPSQKGKAPTPKAQPTKLAILITALRTKKGATISDLMEATGWQAHSVRGAISGALKKKQQLDVTSTLIEGRGRVYRIVE
ncbi:MAG: DUF3489 domain-containing protein [Devosia sp.]